MNRRSKIAELRQQREVLASAHVIATQHDWAKLPELLKAAVRDIDEQIEILQEEIADRQSGNAR